MSDATVPANQLSPLEPPDKAATRSPILRPFPVLTLRLSAAPLKCTCTTAGLDMSMMDMNIDTIQINGEQAEAKASFVFKWGGGSMAMTYLLNRTSKGWTVTKSQPADGSFSHPPMGTPQASDASPASDFTDFINSHAATNKK